MSMKWIIDTDYSSNSQVSLDLLLKNKLEVVAITVTCGIDKRSPFEIKAKIESDLKEKGFVIPVFAGNQEAYIDYQTELKDEKVENPYHLDSKEYKIPKNNNVEKEVSNIDDIASLKIIELINLHGKNLNIISLSALTNLSLAIMLDNTITNKFNKLFICGGSTTGKGNSGVFSEANFRADPVASRTVIQYYNNILLFPMEIETDWKYEKEDLYSNNKEYVEKILKAKKSFLQIFFSAFILNQKIADKIVKQPADVDTIGKLTRGALCLIKYEWLLKEGFNEIEIIDKVDYQTLKSVLKEVN